MSEPIQIERDEEMLGQLAELDLAFAKALYARAMAAEESAEMAELGRTYKAVARSLRQTLALRDRMQRQRRQEAREAAPKPVRDAGRIARRKGELREAVRKVIFHETEGETQDYLWEELDEKLDEVVPDDWGSEPLDAQVAWLCGEFDLPPEAAARWRELPAVTYAGKAPDEPELRSSA
jgi:hypothetical protein